LVKQNTQWEWRGNLSYDYESEDGPGFHIDDRFTTNLHLPSLDQRKWRDENNLNLFVFKKQAMDYYGIYLKSWSLTDRQSAIRQTALTNRISNHTLGLKTIFHLQEDVIFYPYVGYQRSENKSYIDWGWDLGIDAEVNRYNLGDYHINLNLGTALDLYPRRENKAHHVDISIQKKFSSYAYDSLRVAYVTSKQQYYSADARALVDVNIESKNLYNALNYSISSRSHLRFNTILMDRNISDNTPINPNVRKVFRFENRFGYRYLSSSFLFYLGLHTFQENLDNLDFRTDSETLQTGIQTDFSFLINGNDRLDFQFNFIKYQYDTPDMTENHDDRDDIRFIGWARYYHRFSHLLWADIDVDVNLFHKMYLFKEQSANNSWDRMYKIQSTINYEYNNWHNILSTHVLANYTVYDFDHLFKVTRSYMFRNYVISDSLLVPLFYHAFCGFYARLELGDVGSFFKDEFAQNVVEYSQILYYDLFLSKRRVFRFNIEAGVAIYEEKNWYQFAVVNKLRNIRRVSPYIRFLYPLGQNLRFLSQISQNYLIDEGRKKTEYTFAKVDLYYHF
jgi:hypothetical protein